MLDEKQDNLHDADGNLNDTANDLQSENTEALAQDTSGENVDTESPEITENQMTDDSLVVDAAEDDAVEPIDDMLAKESSENDAVPLELLAHETPEANAELPEEIAISDAPDIPEDNTDLIVDETAVEDAEAPLDDVFAEEGKINEDIPEDLISQHPDVPEQREDDDEVPMISQTEGQPIGMPLMDDAVASIADTNAEESEDETLAARHDIPMKDYEAMSMDALAGELETVAGVDKVMSVREHVEEIRRAFLSKYHHFIDEKREEWKTENPDATEDFHYSFPLKSRFDQLYNQYRDRKNAHFKGLQSQLQENLNTRLALVDELKNLINPQENIKDTLKHFNDLRERWKNAGPIPKDKYNHVWNNYHFHVENFYDYLHLDREARDGDFKHNLEQKQRIIARAEELVNEPDVNKAFRELQDLHRLWKEEIGPVSREHREAIWNRFSELTRQMHDKREAIFEKQRGTEKENLEKKRAIISQIAALAQEKMASHNGWLGQIEKVEALRNEFFSAGKVPADVNEETWAAFKTAVRDFNALKNSFYKEIKKDQNDNLSRKQALVARAQELQDNDDFAATTPVMKQIQEEWKIIGHVPRKYSDKLWTAFKAACNHYFERLKESRKEENAEEVEAFEKKKQYLETLREFQLTGQHKTDLDAIKAHIETWKGFGRVPQNRRHIEGKFNKILDVLFEKLSLSKKESEMMRFANRVEQLSENNDQRKLDNEKIFLMRKIDEVQGEIFQLENNIQFFANAKKDNPMVAEVRKNIEKHKEQLEVLKAKLKQLRNIG
jgi:hypothetical protein